MADLSFGRKNLIVVIDFLGDTVRPGTYKHYDCSCEVLVLGKGETSNSEVKLLELKAA